MGEQLNPSTPETDQNADTRIQDPNLAYDVAHDSMVQYRVNELEGDKASAPVYLANGGNPDFVRKELAKDKAKLDEIIDKAAEVYKEP